MIGRLRMFGPVLFEFYLLLNYIIAEYIN